MASPVAEGRRKRKETKREGTPHSTYAFSPSGSVLDFACGIQSQESSLKNLLQYQLKAEEGGSKKPWLTFCNELMTTLKHLSSEMTFDIGDGKSKWREQMTVMTFGWKGIGLLWFQRPKQWRSYFSKQSERWYFQIGRDHNIILIIDQALSEIGA